MKIFTLELKPHVDSVQRPRAASRGCPGPAI